MSDYFGDYSEDQAVYIPFNTFSSDDPSASVTITNLADADIKVHKDGSATQIVTDGATIAIDFDTITGNHLITIDTSAHADYSTGSDYMVRIEGTTIDGGTINAWVGSFSIENRRSAGALRPTTAGRTLDVTATGAAGIDWGNVENKATANDLSGTDIQLVDTATALTNVINATSIVASVSGNVDGSTASVVGAVGSVTGHIAQTGDTYALANGVTGFAAIDTVVDGITTTIGTPIDTDVSTDIANVASQVDNIGAASGGSISFEPTSDNTSAAIIDSVVKVWATVSGTFANVENDDGTSHDFTDTANVIDHVYGFNVGGGRVGSTVSYKCNVNGNADQMLLKAYDHVGATWDTIAVLEGTGGSATVAGSPSLKLKHTGTGAELGNVYIRFDTDSTTPSDLLVSLLNVNAVSTAQSVGYANGAIWIDTLNGVAGSESFVNGTADNPVSNLADALTISAAVGLIRFNVSAGSSITLTAAVTNYELIGTGWTLALGGQSVAGAYILGATVSGVATGSGSIFERCIFDAAVTIPPCVIRKSFFGAATVTLGVGDYYFNQCVDRATGSLTPSLDYGAAIGNTNVNCHDYSGGLEVENMGDTGTDTLVLSGQGRFIGNANCTAGTVTLLGVITEVDNSSNLTITSTLSLANINAEVDTAISDAALATAANLAVVDGVVDDILLDTAEIGAAGAGLTEAGGDGDHLTAINLPNQTMDITGNLSGSVASVTGGINTAAGTLTTLDALDTAQDVKHDATQTDIAALENVSSADVNAACDTALSDYDGPTNAEMAARTPTAAQLAYIVENAATGVPVTFTTLGGSTTAAVLATVDGNAVSATDDQYNGRLLVFTNGTLEDVVTDITDYVGSTGVATITAIPTAPLDTHTARLI